jgi:hypothetical protein
LRRLKRERVGARLRGPRCPGAPGNVLAKKFPRRQAPAQNGAWRAAHTKNRDSQRHAMTPPTATVRGSSGISTTAMSAMGMANACLRFKKCARTRLNTRPGSCLGGWGGVG